MPFQSVVGRNGTYPPSRRRRPSRCVYGVGGCSVGFPKFIPFSAFWLRSCVVSVLISLIAYMGIIDSLRLTLISLGADPMGVLAPSERQDGAGTALQPSPSTPIK